MIKNMDKLDAIRKDWEYARSRRTFIERHAGHFANGGLAPLTLMDFAANLVLVFAFAVLDDALEQLERECWFKTKGTTLGARMEASKLKLPWVDFASVDKGRDMRNDIAHRQKDLIRRECWRYFGAIEREFIEWEILPDPALNG